MSNGDYMRPPPQGLKTNPEHIAGFSQTRPPHPFLPWSFVSFKWDRSTAMKLLYAPFDDELTNPGIYRTIVVMLLVYIGALLNGWLYILMLSSSLTATVADIFIRYVLMAAVVAGGLAMCSNWTYEENLQTYIYPEFSFAMIGTFKVGVLTALLYGVFQFGGFLSAGGILHAILGTTAGLTNVANSSNSYILAWFGSSIIIFNYLFNKEFKQRKYASESDSHTRANNATFWSIFIITAAFFQFGLLTYSSGLYAAGVLVTQDPTAIAGTAPTADQVMPWAFFIFVPLLASTATAVLLYMIIGWVLSGDRTFAPFGVSTPKKSDDNPFPPEYLEGSRSQVSAAAYHGLSKRTQQKLHVNY